MRAALGNLAVVAFLVLWAFPVLWHGVSARPLPGDFRRLHICHDVACLFSERPTAWNTYFVQVRRDGPVWETLDISPYFAMEPFGHRTRLHRFLINWGLGPPGDRRREELAQWFFARHRALFPTLVQPTALRFASTQTVPDPARPPTGAWRPPTIDEVAPERLRVLSVHVPEAR